MKKFNMEKFNFWFHTILFSASSAALIMLIENYSRCLATESITCILVWVLGVIFIVSLAMYNGVEAVHNFITMKGKEE